MNTTYTASKTPTGFVAFGPFGSTMRADKGQQVTYCNLNPGTKPYSRLLRAIAKAAA